MGDSMENLKKAFAGESQANRHYVAFAKKAEKENLAQIAKLFRAAAEAETIHALNHLEVLGEVKSARDNLAAAISGETFEYKTMYPEYYAAAETEGNKRAAWSFDVANKVEKIHAELFSKALKTLEAGGKMPPVEYYVCGVCGNTVENEAPERCPICGAPKARFSKVV